jgi:hypothetical protein
MLTVLAIVDTTGLGRELELGRLNSVHNAPPITPANSRARIRGEE